MCAGKSRVQLPAKLLMPALELKELPFLYMYVVGVYAALPVPLACANRIIKYLPALVGIKRLFAPVVIPFELWFVVLKLATVVVALEREVVSVEFQP